MHITAALHPGYRLRRLRGHGGYGEVWEAENDKGDTVALKFMQCARDQGAAHELRSIQLIKEMPHPHLVRMDKVWCAEDFLVIAMELADGSLGDLLQVYRDELCSAIPARHVLPLLAQIATALDFLNNRQHLVQGQWVTIQHCDVKPMNMLLFGEAVKLTDFGLTTTLVAEQKNHERAGTPAFAAPEVFRGLVGQRTDQYALGVSYCLLRSGHMPFADTPETFQAGYVRPAPDLGALDAVERPAVARALAPLPYERWPSCREFIAELQKATAPAGAAANSGRGESRREARVQTDTRIDCQILATLGNQAWTTQVQNLSQGGVRLRIAKPGCILQPGRVLELTLANGSGGRSVAVALRLAHATELADGDYEVGGAFLQALSPRDLADLMRSK